MTFHSKAVLYYCHVIKTNTKTTKKMKTVTVIMTDEITEKEVVRTIDVGNIMIPDYKAPLGWECDIIAPQEKQKELLERWISERGNEQHDTILTLNSWSIN